MPRFVLAELLAKLLRPEACVLSDVVVTQLHEERVGRRTNGVEWSGTAVRGNWSAGAEVSVGPQVIPVNLTPAAGWGAFFGGRAGRTVDGMHTPFEKLTAEYAAALPGIVRATLVDRGISEEFIERRQIGWDGEYIAVPVRNRVGRVVFFERWNGSGLCRPVEELGTVELYPWDALLGTPRRLFLAEGIHEALVFESHGLPAVSATGTGLFFKEREWGWALGNVPEVVIAYGRGDKRPRRSFLLSSSQLVEQVQQAIPKAKVLMWPEAVGAGGAFDFFVRLRKNAADLEALLEA